MLLSSTLLQRVCNNFMVVEIWNRVGPHDQGDKVKLNSFVDNFRHSCYCIQLLFSTNFYMKLSEAVTFYCIGDFLAS